MHPDVKTVGWWTLYAVLLMLISGASYVTAPRAPGPTLSVEANPTGFEPSGTVEIRFRLSRPATRPLTVHYVLEGDAERGKDYDLADPAQRTVEIPTGEEVSPPLVLKKIPSPPSSDGTRRTEPSTVVVALKSAEPFAPDPRASRLELPIEVVRFRVAKGPEPPVKTIPVPDPKVELAWSVDPPGPLDRSKPSTSRLRVTLDQPRSDPVTVRYTATSDPDLSFTGPPDDSGGLRSITVAPGALSAEQEFLFPADPFVGGPPKKLRLELVGVTPEGRADPARLGPLEILTADDGPLGGRALVLVVYTADLAAKSQDVLKELKIAENRSRERLVGGSLYLLAGDRSIYRIQADAEALKAREPFAPDASYVTILNAAVEKVAECFNLRAADKKETILVWQDSAEKTTAGGDVRKFVGIPDLTWQLVWIGPPREKSALAGALEKLFHPMVGKPKYLGLERPEERLSAALGSLLPGGRE